MFQRQPNGDDFIRRARYNSVRVSPGPLTITGIPCTLSAEEKNQDPPGNILNPSFWAFSAIMTFQSPSSIKISITLGDDPTVADCNPGHAHFRTTCLQPVMETGHLVGFRPKSGYSRLKNELSAQDPF